MHMGDTEYMSKLIAEALAAADGVPLDCTDSESHPVVQRLASTLRKTGPLYHNGAVFKAGEGESFHDFIEVIEDIRIASEVPIPID